MAGFARKYESADSKPRPQNEWLNEHLRLKPWKFFLSKCSRVFNVYSKFTFVLEQKKDEVFCQYLIKSFVNSAHTLITLRGWDNNLQTTSHNDNLSLV